MQNSTKRFIIASVALLVTAVITFGAYSLKNYSGELYTQRIPLFIGEWQGKELGMDERTYEILETKDTIMRQYTLPSQSGDPNESMMLAVVFSQNNRKVAHPPEVCFAGGGWERSDKGIETIMIGNRELRMNKLILQKDSWRQVALYIYKSGDRLTENYYAQQINIILNGMIRKDTSSALIRFSSVTSEDSINETLALTKRFAGEIIPVLEKKLP